MRRKWFLVLALVVLLALPALALGEITWEANKNFITFAELDGLKAYFRKANEWTIVTRDNFEEHLNLITARGETVDEARQRFAQQTLLFEAYADFLPDDVCIRLERFEDEASRQIWHFRHFSSQERKDYLEAVNNGELLAAYDTFAGEFKTGKVLLQHLECGYTTRPPYAYESGKMEIRYINGRCYVLTYAVKGRAASRTKLRKGSENGKIKDTPFNENYPLSFDADYEPTLTPLEWKDVLPAQAAPGTLKAAGTVERGGKIQATLDGESLMVQVNKKGDFTLSLPLKEPGDHELILTATHKDHTARQEVYAINVSDKRTPLVLTAFPEAVALAGDQRIAGETAPGAAVTLALDDREPVTLTADSQGKFDFTFHVMDDLVHGFVVTAQGEEQDENVATVLFATEYETFKEGLKAFEKNLTKETIATLAKAPETFVGEKVKISVKVQELIYTQEGLGVLCTYNPPRGSKHAKTPLYLTLYSYAQDQIYEGMIMTIYGTVDGAETFLKQEGNETRMRILMQYGTYLT